MASVLITGASKGIGRAAAAELARRGHRVIATARDPRTLAGAAGGRTARARRHQPRQHHLGGRGGRGRLDASVSNAGEIFVAAVEATPPEALARLLDINTIGALRVAQAVLPGMRARGRGRLLFLSSIAGRIVPPREAACNAATKWALEALVEALAIEAGPLGIEAALARTRPGQLRRARPRYHLHPARRFLYPPARPRRYARQPDDAGRGRGRDRRRGRGAAAAPAHPHRPAPPRSWPHAGPHPTTARSSPLHPRPSGRERQMRQSEGES